MSVEDFIIELFCRIDATLQDGPKHWQAKLYRSEVVTLGMVFTLKGGSGGPYNRWLNYNWRTLFPNMPDRTRLFRLFVSRQHLTERFMADPIVLVSLIVMGLN